MIYFGIVVVLIVIIAIVFRDNNPFKLILYIGAKGSGKTCCLVRDLYKFHKRGYIVYTTLKSVDYPWINFVTIQDIEEKVFPPYSVFAVDEAGIVYDNRNFKKFSENQRDYYKYQRQYRNVVILTSQTWDIDAKLRALTDTIHLCSKVGPCIFTRRVKRGLKIKEATAEGESRIADDLRFVPFGWTFASVYRWGKHFSSYSPPERPFIIPAEYPRNYRGKPRRIPARRK